MALSLLSQCPGFREASDAATDDGSEDGAAAEAAPPPTAAHAPLPVFYTPNVMRQKDPPISFLGRPRMGQYAAVAFAVSRALPAPAAELGGAGANGEEEGPDGQEGGDGRDEGSAEAASDAGGGAADSGEDDSRTEEDDASDHGGGEEGSDHGGEEKPPPAPASETRWYVLGVDTMKLAGKPASHGKVDLGALQTWARQLCGALGNGPGEDAAASAPER